MTALISSFNQIKMPNLRTRMDIYSSAHWIGSVFKFFPQYRLYAACATHSVCLITHSDQLKNSNHKKLEAALRLVTIASHIAILYAQIYSHQTLFIAANVMNSATYLYNCNNFKKTSIASRVSHTSALLLNSWKFSLLGSLITSVKCIFILRKYETSTLQKVNLVSGIIVDCLLPCHASQEEPLELWKFY